MATFVEKAVLMIDDKSSRKLSKIERAMKDLNKQAQLLEKRLPKIKLDGLSSRHQNVELGWRTIQSIGLISSSKSSPAGEGKPADTLTSDIGTKKPSGIGFKFIGVNDMR